MKSSDIKEPRHKEFFEQAKKEMEAITGSAATSIVADSVAVNRQLVEFLVESRHAVEQEAVLVIDAMCLAFDGKSEKLKTLKSVTEQVSAESAFMKGALSSIETKTSEIVRLTAAIDGLSASMERFKALVEDGTLDRAARAAQVLS